MSTDKTAPEAFEVYVSTSIAVAHKFVGFHCWPDAPAEVDFLRFRHRHIFGVKLQLTVTHNDRQLEFFMIQRELRSVCAQLWEDKFFNSSCEDIAQQLVVHFAERGYGVLSATVDEDGENSASVVVMNISPSLRSVTIQTPLLAS